MRDDLKRALLLGFLAALAGLAQGCATSSSSPAVVQELEPGTYAIGISRTSSYLADGNKAIANAVDTAGAHCHAKGQKFMLKSAVSKTLVFRCVPMNPGAAAPQAAAPPAAATPLAPPPATPQ